MKFLIAAFERAAKIRKIAVYRFTISFLVISYNGLKKRGITAKSG